MDKGDIFHKTVKDLMYALEEDKDKAYRERNLVLALLVECLKRGMTSNEIGIKQDDREDWEDEWRNVLFIDLPTGQISWHLHKSELVNFPNVPKYQGNYDGHTTEEKYERIKKFILG